MTQSDSVGSVVRGPFAFGHVPPDEACTKVNADRDIQPEYPLARPDPGHDPAMTGPPRMARPVIPATGPWPWRPRRFRRGTRRQQRAVPAAATMAVGRCLGRRRAASSERRSTAASQRRPPEERKKKKERKENRKKKKKQRKKKKKRRKKKQTQKKKKKKKRGKRGKKRRGIEKRKQAKQKKKKKKKEKETKKTHGPLNDGDSLLPHASASNAVPLLLSVSSTLRW